MSDDAKGTTVALMAEIQKDERAFALLTGRLLSERDDMTYGKLLGRDGDPRQWPEYAND